jgi:hypothetical protein
MHWGAAGAEMRESRVLIAQLNEKLSGELHRRKADLARSQATTAFMKDEQKSLIYAMMHIKLEIENLHRTIAKSAMRYFVDIKPIHEHVVQDVPAALAHYMAQKEQEKARLLAVKAAQAAAVTPTQKPPKQPVAVGLKPARRKTILPGAQPHAKKGMGTFRQSAQKMRKSVAPGTSNLEIVEEDD